MSGGDGQQQQHINFTTTTAGSPSVIAIEHHQHTNKIINPEKYIVSKIDLLFNIISMITRIIAVSLNINLALEYHRAQQIHYFLLTTLCIIIPMLVGTAIYFSMFVHDQKRKSLHKNYNHCEIFIYVILIPMIFRYSKSLYLSMKCRQAKNRNDSIKQRIYYKAMIEEESDVTLVRIFECFLDAAPQKILQIYIIIILETAATWSQIASILGCFVSLSWCMLSYNKYNRYAQIDKNDISIIGITCQTIWYFCTTLSRILCIAMMASIFPKWTILSYSIHSICCGLVLFVWDKPAICSTQILRLLFSLLLGCVNIFVYISPKDGPTKYRYITYYIICNCENIATLLLFMIYSTDTMKLYFLYVPICVLSNVMYLIGIGFMLIYYNYFHPNIKKNVINN